MKSLCLGILYFQDATGYEINKLSSEGRFSHFIEASYGSIYPALTKLTQDGLVSWREEQEEGKPARKVYSITQQGRTNLVNSLHEQPKEDVFKSEFLFICLYAQALEQNHLEQMLDHKIQKLQDELQKLSEKEECCDHPGSNFAIGYGKAINQAALGYIIKNRHILTKIDEQENQLSEISD